MLLLLRSQAKNSRVEVALWPFDDCFSHNPSSHLVHLSSPLSGLQVTPRGSKPRIMHFCSFSNISLKIHSDLWFCAQRSHHLLAFHHITKCAECLKPQCFALSSILCPLYWIIQMYMPDSCQLLKILCECRASNGFQHPSSPSVNFSWAVIDHKYRFLNRFNLHFSVKLTGLSFGLDFTGFVVYLGSHGLRLAFHVPLVFSVILLATKWRKPAVLVLSSQSSWNALSTFEIQHETWNILWLLSFM